MTLIANEAGVTLEAGELTVDPVSGIHERFVGVTTPTLLRLPPTQSAKTRSVASGLAVVSVSQALGTSEKRLRCVKSVGLDQHTIEIQAAQQPLSVAF